MTGATCPFYFNPLQKVSTLKVVCQREKINFESGSFFEEAEG
jgi:hypothetical protein